MLTPKPNLGKSNSQGFTRNRSMCFNNDVHQISRWNDDRKHHSKAVRLKHPNCVLLSIFFFKLRSYCMAKKRNWNKAC